MKALILAAGLGTRLRPLTDTIPKALVPINGKPLLAYHFDSLQKHGVDRVLINTHYLGEQVKKFSEEYAVKNPQIKISVSFESELLGSAGTLRKHRDFFEGEKDFLIVYGDNLTNIDYGKFMDFHKKKNALATMASYFEKDPSSKGIIVSDDDHKISLFIEKPAKKDIVSNYANAGIYACRSEIFSHLEELNKPVLDFGNDVFPSLLAKNEALYSYPMTEFLLDIGTPETYNEAHEKVQKLKF